MSLPMSGGGSVVANQEVAVVSHEDAHPGSEESRQVGLDPATPIICAEKDASESDDDETPRQRIERTGEHELDREPPKK